MKKRRKACLLALFALLVAGILFVASKGWQQVLAKEQRATLVSFAKDVSYEIAGMGKGNWTNDFVLRSQGEEFHGFCVNPSRYTPKVGSSFRVTEIKDPLVRKILYYGYGSYASLGRELKLSAEEELIVTHVSLAKATGDGEWSDNLSTRGKEICLRFLEEISKRKTPREDLQRAFLCHNTKAREQNLLYSMHKKEEPPKSKIRLYKKAKGDKWISGNPLYSLKGTRYGLFADAQAKQMLAEKELEAKGEVYTADFGELLVDQTYYIRETKAPEMGSFRLDERIYEIKVKQSEKPEEDNRLTVEETPIFGDLDLLLRKRDSQRNDAHGTSGERAASQGDGSLEGALYEISYYPIYGKSVAELSAEKPLQQWFMHTDAKGEIHLQDRAQTIPDLLLPKQEGKRVLLLGSYLIREKEPPRDDQGRETYALDPKSYLLCIRPEAKQGFTIEKDVALEGVPEEILRGGILLEKRDADFPEGGDYTAGLGLSGIRFSLINRSKETVSVDLNHNGIYEEKEFFAPGEKIRELVTRAYGQEEARRLYGIETKAPEIYLATTDDDGDGIDHSLPFGSYGVVEERSLSPKDQKDLVNASYSMSKSKEQRLELKGDLLRDQWYLDKKQAPLCFAEENWAVRGDLTFVKCKESSMERLQVPFLLVCEESEEKHIILTDANGRFDSSSRHIPHSLDTNANDKYLDTLSWSPEEGLKQEEVIALTGLNPECGLWFGRGRYGGQIPPQEERGALPKGHYQLIELRSDQNLDQELLQIRISVGQSLVDPFGKIDLGTLDNREKPPEFPPQLYQQGTMDLDLGRGPLLRGFLIEAQPPMEEIPELGSSQKKETPSKSKTPPPPKEPPITRNPPPEEPPITKNPPPEEPPITKNPPPEEPPITKNPPPEPEKPKRSPETADSATLPAALVSACFAFSLLGILLKWSRM